MKSKRGESLQKISVSAAAKKIKGKILDIVQNSFGIVKIMEKEAKDFGANVGDGIKNALEKTPKAIASMPTAEEAPRKHKAKFLAIFSGKGGVGKTTTAVNLGLALKNLGKKVVVVDANMETPNISLHLEIPPAPVNLHYVLNGSGEISLAIYAHESGLNVIPAGISMEDSKNFNAENLKKAIMPLREQFDWVLIDCPPGLWGNVSEIIRAADEVLIVTNPELPALIDSLKAIKTAQSLKVNIRGVVLNKVTGSKYDTDGKIVKNILNEPIMAKIPYDKNVRKSIAERVPLISYRPRSPASRSFKALAARLEGKKYIESDFEKMLSFMGL